MLQCGAGRSPDTQGSGTVSTVSTAHTVETVWEIHPGGIIGTAMNRGAIAENIRSRQYQQILILSERISKINSSHTFAPYYQFQQHTQFTNLRREFCLSLLTFDF